MVDAMGSSVSGRELAALGHVDGTPAMLAASVAARQRGVDAQWRPAPPASGGRGAAKTRQIAQPSARDRGVNHLGRPCQLAVEPLQPPAHARVQPMGADLEDDAPDQLRIDLPARLHLAARGLLDLPEELPRLLVGELDRGRQLGPEDALVLCDEALELARDLLEMRGAALVREQEEEVAQKLVAALEQVPNRLCPGARVELWVAQELPQLRHRGLRFHHLCQLLADGLEPSLILRRVEEGARVDAVDYRHLAPLEHREVELAEGFLDQPAMVLVVERLAGDLARGQQAQVDDLDANLLESAARLGLDLAPGLFEPALPVGLGLLSHPPLVRLRDLARLGEDLLGVALRTSDQLAVLLEQAARLLTRLVRLLDRLHDPLAPLVDRPLDRPERVALQHPERDQEADDRPDHQPRGDLDQCVRGDHQEVSTKPGRRRGSSRAGRRRRPPR